MHLKFNDKCPYRRYAVADKNTEGRDYVIRSRGGIVLPQAKVYLEPSKPG